MHGEPCLLRTCVHGLLINQAQVRHWVLAEGHLIFFLSFTTRQLPLSQGVVVTSSDQQCLPGAYCLVNWAEQLMRVKV